MNLVNPVPDQSGPTVTLEHVTSSNKNSLAFLLLLIAQKHYTPQQDIPGGGGGRGTSERSSETLCDIRFIETESSRAYLGGEPSNSLGRGDSFR